MVGRPRVNALVTGASGFIGRHLVEALLESGHHVVVLVRPSSRIPETWQGRVERVDCADWAMTGFDRAVGSRDVDVVYHLAAYGVRPTDREVATMLHINVDAVANIVMFCKQREASLVIAGSNSEYRQPADNAPLPETAPLEERKLYGTSKAAGSLLACAVAEQLSVRLRVLRLFNVYGPGEAPHRLLPHLVAAVAKSGRVPLTVGTQIRDFVYVEDVVEAFLAAGTQIESRAGPMTAIWNVCTGVGHSVRDFALMAAEAIGETSDQLAFGEQAMRVDEVPWLVGNCDRIKAELGWSARHDLASGLRASVAQMTDGKIERGGIL